MRNADHLLKKRREIGEPCALKGASTVRGRGRQKRAVMHLAGGLLYQKNGAIVRGCGRRSPDWETRLSAVDGTLSSIAPVCQLLPAKGVAPVEAS